MIQRKHIIRKKKVIKIFEENVYCEKTFSGDGRDLQQIYARHGINSNTYLIESGIYESQFERIVALCS